MAFCNKDCGDKQCARQDDHGGECRPSTKVENTSTKGDRAINILKKMVSALDMAAESADKPETSYDRGVATASLSAAWVEAKELLSERN